MFDWSTAFPYVFIATILLICVGIYGIVSAKKFIKIIFGMEFLLFASNILLLSFNYNNQETDPFAQTLSIFIIIVGIAFAIVGLSIDKRLRTIKDSTEIEFDFSVEDGVVINELENISEPLQETETG